MKVNLTQRPGPNADLKTVRDYLSRFSEVALRALTRNVSYTDNICGALITGPSSAGSAANTGLAMPHGVPVLVKNPLPQNAKPVGVQVLNCDTQCNPSVQISSSAIVNGVLTPAPAGYFYLTALYPVPITDWVPYTPTGTWTSNVVYAGLWRRVSDTLEVNLRISTTGLPGPGTLTDVFIPSGLVIDVSKLAVGNRQNATSLGTGDMQNAGLGFFALNVGYHSTTSVRPLWLQSASSGILENGINPTLSPGTFASNDFIYFKFAVPIVGWGISSVTANVTLFVAGA